MPQPEPEPEPQMPTLTPEETMEMVLTLGTTGKRRRPLPGDRDDPNRGQHAAAGDLVIPPCKHLSPPRASTSFPFVPRVPSSSSPPHHFPMTGTGIVCPCGSCSIGSTTEPVISPFLSSCFSVISL